jgi:predicted membrane channel-forming protein YqfA (hemolysin III family)
MSDELPRGVKVIEAHEELVQHIERGESRIRRLSLVTIVAVGLLVLAYVSQILLPLATGTTSVTVNLADPALIAGEVVILALGLVWLCVAVADYLFSGKLGRQIREIREMEREVMTKAGLTEDA